MQHLLICNKLDILMLILKPNDFSKSQFLLTFFMQCERSCPLKLLGWTSIARKGVHLIHVKRNSKLRSQLTMNVVWSTQDFHAGPSHISTRMLTKILKILQYPFEHFPEEYQDLAWISSFTRVWYWYIFGSLAIQIHQ